MDPLIPPQTLKRLVTAVCLAVAWCAAARGAEVSMSVSAGRDSLYLGESLVLTVRVNGVDDASGAPVLDAVRDCDVRLLGSHSESQTSISVVNGRMTRQSFQGRIFSYEVTPRQAGILTIGPIVLQAGGRTLRQPGPRVTVAGVEAQDWVVIGVEAERQSVLIEEPFDVRLTLRLRGLDGAYQDSEPLDPREPPQLNIPYLGRELPGLEGPDVRQVLQGLLADAHNAPGFLINDFSVQRDPFDNFFNMNINSPFQRNPAIFRLARRRDERDGRRDWVYTLALRYVAREEGEHTFGPVLFKGKVVTNADAQGRAQTHPVFAVGAAATVRVVPPPEAGRPSNYVGVLGKGLTVEASVDSQTCRLGDPLQLSVRIAGDVNIAKLRPPAFWELEALRASFRLYEDTLQTQRDDGAVTYRMTMRPIVAGTIEVPPIPAAYYDTTARAYRTVTSKPLPLRVDEAPEFRMDDVIEIAGETSDQARRGDRTPSGIMLAPHGARGESLAGGRAVLATALAGPVFLALTVLGLGAVRLRARWRGRGARGGALRRALRALGSGDGGEGGRAAGLSRAMRRYLAERLGVQRPGLTAHDCRRLLLERGAGEEQAAAFGGLLDRLDAAAFGGGAHAGGVPEDEVRAMLLRLDATLGRGEKSARGRRGGGAAALVCVAILASGAARPAHAAADDRFAWAQAGAAAAAARTPEEFRAAADVYRDMVREGVRNGPLFYNLGTCLLLAGDHEEAAFHLRRAERYLGADDDVRCNLALALTGGDENVAPALPWTRIPLFFHYGLPGKVRATAAAAGVVLLCLGAALRLLRARRIARWCVTAGVVLTVVFGSSVAISLLAEARDDARVGRTDLSSMSAFSCPLSRVPAFSLTRKGLWP